jgi:hypothetical protein
MGSGLSFIAERAYTGEMSANSAKQSPEPHPSTQTTHRSLVYHAFDHVG